MHFRARHNLGSWQETPHLDQETLTDDARRLCADSVGEPVVRSMIFVYA